MVWVVAAVRVLTGVSRGGRGPYLGSLSAARTLVGLLRSRSVHPCVSGMAVTLRALVASLRSAARRLHCLLLLVVAGVVVVRRRRGEDGQHQSGPHTYSAVPLERWI